MTEPRDSSAPAAFAPTLRERADHALAPTQARGFRSTVEPAPRSLDEPTRQALASFDALASAERASGVRSLVLDERIGEGGMGVVHRARQVVLGRTVAVKALPEATHHPTRALELLREAWVTGALEHPHIVPIHHVGVDERGGPLVAMKRIDGLVWSEVMHQPELVSSRFGAADALEWNLRVLLSVAQALAFAHSRGVIHRDVKPDNVMVGTFGEVYLLDWGLAVTLRDDEWRLPRAREANDLAGTPAYMAPEMVGGQAARLGPGTDVYLLGATLYELVVGRPPHDGPSLDAVLASVVGSAPSFPSGTDPELERIARRAMSAEPTDRYPTVEELRAELEQYLRHRGARALGAQADASRATLNDAIANDAPDEVLYDLLGECRFGYRAALASWPEYAEARAGLDAALVRMAERALAAGDSLASEHLLLEVAAPSAELVTRVREAEQRRQAELARLTELGQQLDKGPGARTRVVVMTLIGSFWVAAPAAAQWQGRDPTYSELASAFAGMLAFLGVLGVWARESLTKTLVNRRLGAVLALILVAHLSLVGAAAAAGAPVRPVEQAGPLLWAGVLGCVSLWVETRLWPSAVLALALGCFGVMKPQLLHGAIALFNAALTANVVWAWLPREDIANAEERVRALVQARVAARRDRWKRHQERWRDRGQARQK